MLDVVWLIPALPLAGFLSSCCSAAGSATRRPAIWPR